MAQGTIKSKKLTTATARGSGGRNTVLGPKKGARTIAPRKSVLVRNAGMTKKHSSGLTAMTERTLGAKAGHLEILKGGKKNKDAKDGKAVHAKKGGSNKFG
ncbi:hypothetical protein BJ878DRAFT_460303 [Calycina marina]|uniref:Uncharacterized protein n=1 Tax=Calycina marina TaxID=1763456 RepID=A0A9P7Z3F3_9HELO|nr:hypothetical protein BJ878DRAFT_460303 [Calycina marina]